MRPDKMLVDKIASQDAATKWSQWQVVNPMINMLDGLAAKVAPRKMRLFAMECCRRIDRFTQDAECAQALALCGQMLAGEDVDAQAIALRERIQFRRNRTLRGQEQSTISEWALSAATDLLQTDREYFLNDGPELTNVHSMCMSAGVRSQRNIRRWEDVRLEDFESVGAIFENQAEILTEILGNPFEAIDVDSTWRTNEVVALARQHDQSPTRELMEQLLSALVRAGCSDERILSHCRIPCQHLVGCWVVDMLLERPTFAEPGEAWGYKLEIDGENEETIRAIKQLFVQLACHADGTPKSIGSADIEWILSQFETLGLSAWVQLSRCITELRAPSSRSDYVEAMAKFGVWKVAARHRLRWPVLPSPFSLWPERWWDQEHLGSDHGLPGVVSTHKAGAPPIHPDQIHTALIQILSHLPVRDVTVNVKFFDSFPQFLQSPAGQAINSLRTSFGSTTHGMEPVTSLCTSGLVQTLRRLVIMCEVEGPQVRELAATPFEALEELYLRDHCSIQCEASDFVHLAEQSWFQQLKTICADFRGPAAPIALPHLSRLPSLQTLALAQAKNENFDSDEAIVFPALKRFYLKIDNVKPSLKALLRYQAPELIEFWLDSFASSGRDLIELLRSDLLKHINILRLSTPRLTAQAVDAMLLSPFAQQLKILQLKSHQLDGFSKKSKALWSREDTLPELVSLAIDKLFSQPNYQDCADWLSQFACPKIRHLTLSECHLNETCLEAILRNPVFKNLESLVISEGYRKSYVSPEYVEPFVRSLDLPNLRWLHLGSVPIGDRIEFLTDPAVLPNVLVAGFIDTGASADVIKRIEAVRPRFNVQD